MREKKKKLSKIRYLNSLRLKHDSLDIEWKETGKAFNKLAMDVLNLFVFTLIKFTNILLTLMNKLLTNSGTELLNIWYSLYLANTWINSLLALMWINKF